MRSFIGLTLVFSSLSICFSQESIPTFPIYPKVLFHGGGGGTPPRFKDMSSAKTQMVLLGFPTDHIFEVRYPDSKNLADINASLKPQLEGIFARYPPETKFDLIGHSLGHVVSLVSMAQLGSLEKVRKLIGLAGVMFGQLGGKPGLCAFSFLAPYYCGDIFDLLVGTTQPPFILDLLDTHWEEMKRIEKCSLFSPEDGILNPFDSGAFEDGINISLPQVHHLKFKSSPQVFFQMKEACFKDAF